MVVGNILKAYGDAKNTRNTYYQFMSNSDILIVYLTKYASGLHNKIFHSSLSKAHRDTIT